MQQKFNKGICSGCNKERLITVKSKKLCAYCAAKASAKRTIERKKKKGVYIEQNKLEAFYEEFYNEHPTKTCFETGEFLPTYKNWLCHHLLLKSKYPEHKFNKDVMVLLSLQQHSLFHNLDRKAISEKMPNCYKKLLELETLYGINQ